MSHVSSFCRFGPTMDQEGRKPSCILLFSGKRKSGKDYFTDRLLEASNADQFVVIKISAPIKSHFAKYSNLDLKELMGDGVYKETYRKEMINWSEQKRAKDPGIFCKAAIDMYNAYSKKVWIVSDVRRKSDIKWFKDNFGDVVKTVRIEASNDVRESRGWNFVSGIDDAPSECDLDDYKDWSWKLDNSGDIQKFNVSLVTITEYLKSYSTI